MKQRKLYQDAHNRAQRRYYASLADKGLKKITLIVPVSSVEAFKREAQRLRDELASEDA